MDKLTLEAHWKKSRNLMILVLLIWFFFAYFLHIFVGSLNEISFIGFPLGYYFSAQGSLFAFVILVAWFAHRQNKIDEEFGLSEEES